nr:Hsp70 family protein [Jatrophihabitans sp. GAS493]
MFVADDGSLLCGAVAERAGVHRPERLVRNFRGGLGEPSPILIDSAPYSVETLLAAVLVACLDDAEQLVGERPERVVVTCPVSWGAFRRERFDDVLVLAGVGGCVVVSDAQAVARRWFSAQGTVAGRHIAIFDVGGGAVEAVVLRSGVHGAVPEIVGVPVGSDRVGGDAFDKVLGQHLSGSTPEQLRAVKHELSRVQQSTLPDGRQISRGEFEELVRPLVRSSVQVLTEAIRSAGIEQLDAVLLVGGSARIPLLLTAIEDTVECPVEVVDQPDTAVALGAADLAADPAVTGSIATASMSATLSGSSALSSSPATRWSSRAVLLTVLGALVAVVLLVIVLGPGRGSGRSPIAEGSNSSHATTSGTNPSNTPSHSSAAPSTSDDSIPQGPGPVSTYYIVRDAYQGQQEFLFEIADRFLGDGDRLGEIFALNKGRLQPDGAALTDVNDIESGWILVLPADAKGAGVQHGPLPCCFPTPVPVSASPAS